MNVGTVSGPDGEFALKYPEGLTKDSIIVLYVGYNNDAFAAKDQKGLEIGLKSATFQFEEFVVYSISPADFVKKAIRKIGDNYMDADFQTLSYYNEKMYEEN